MTFLSNWALITVNTEDRCVILSTGILKCSAGVIVNKPVPVFVDA